MPPLCQTWSGPAVSKQVNWSASWPFFLAQTQREERWLENLSALAAPFLALSLAAQQALPACTRAAVHGAGLSFRRRREPK